MPPVTDISTRDARRLFLHRQGLLRRYPFGRGGQAVARAIERLGWVQIDTISVVERAHHHVLRSRVAGYRPGWLDDLQHKDRAVFEYWSHAAAYLPMRDYRFALPRMEAMRNRTERWIRSRDDKLMAEVLTRVEAEGPLMARQFESSESGESGWCNWKPAKRALEQLFMQGDRDAAARVLPDELADDMSLVGPRDRIRERLQAWRDSKVTTMLVATTDKDDLRQISELF